MSDRHPNTEAPFIRLHLSRKAIEKARQEPENVEDLARAFRTFLEGQFHVLGIKRSAEGHPQAIDIQDVNPIERWIPRIPEPLEGTISQLRDTFSGAEWKGNGGR